MNDPHQALSRDDLLAQLDAAPADEQRIMEVLSVAYRHTHPSTVAGTLRGAGIRLAALGGWSRERIGGMLEDLAERGLVQERLDRYRAADEIVEVCTRRAAAAGRLPPLIRALRQAAMIHDGDQIYAPQSFRQAMRNLRFGVYMGDLALTVRALSAVEFLYPSECRDWHPLARIAANPFDPQWLSTLDAEIRGPVLAAVSQDAWRRLQPLPGLDEALAAGAKASRADRWASFAFRRPLAERRLLAGEVAVASGMVDLTDPPAAAGIRGWAAFLRGDDRTAVSWLEEYLKALKKEARRQIPLPGLLGPIYVLALLRRGDDRGLTKASDYLAMARQGSLCDLPEVLASLDELIRQHRGLEAGMGRAAAVADHTGGTPRAGTLFELLIRRWTGASDGLLEGARALHAAARRGGYAWIAAEAATLMERLGDAARAEEARALRERQGIVSIVDLVAIETPWERTLSALIRACSGEEPAPGAQAGTGGGDARLVWIVAPADDGWLAVEPRLQKRGTSGQWSRGRAMPLKRLAEERAGLHFLAPEDLPVCAAIRQRFVHGWSRGRYVIDREEALRALVGHPRVFHRDAPDTRLEVIKGEPELVVAQVEDGLALKMDPPCPPDARVVGVQDGPTRIKVLELKPQHRVVSEIIAGGLMVPPAGREKVEQVIAAASVTMPVQSEIGAGELQQVEPDPRPHVHLMPAGGGLMAEVLVRPLAGGGSYHRPGSGGATVVAVVDGRRLQTRRDLERERDLARAAMDRCPMLTRGDPAAWAWTLEDPEQCLEALIELKAIGDQVVLEWPQGETLKVTAEASPRNLRLKIKRERDWFQASGELQVNESTVVDLMQLLELARRSESRFIPLGEGRYLALTRTFRRRLEELTRVSETTAKGLRLHPLAAVAAPALQELAGEAGKAQTDKHWREDVRRMEEAESLEPELPTTLRAELRDYQLDGYRWLARLAQWGVGACLSDDMGLGKTVQALALILARAQAGPALVVAPTSVCMNWMDEAARFAPTLRATLFGPGDRKEALRELGPLDLVVCSYGLLVQEDDALAAVRWQTAVLDEAQAIKNAATKRSQAAMRLRAGFRMVTTGTPLENHLGELWNLFRFINPGLLGSLERFNKRFAGPIERGQDAGARNHLKRLIQPFVLRRTKGQVLEELPARTEVTLSVDLGEEERAFYETLRRQAVDRLQRTEGPEAQERVRVLAEIMRLRRACCNARLVSPELRVPSAKLDTFTELLEELRENRHKALVFSQFVDHLTVLRGRLDSLGVPYQYLDGATAPAERKRRVDAFQAGAGEVFLISLRAGGLGLNLTAADYVIHMDPWWNPAVEDQASDRAHRIGQHRPVTIYRIVARGTIEEQIVELHRGKRDLADSLLEGTDAAVRLSLEELKALLAGA